MPTLRYPLLKTGSAMLGRKVIKETDPCIFSYNIKHGNEITVKFDRHKGHK